MLSVREQYRRYSLFVLIASLGVTVFLCLMPFLSGLLGAATIYVLLRGQMRVLAGRYRWRRSAAAALLTVEAVCCFLVPIALLVWMVVNKVQGVALDPQALVDSVRHVAELVRDRTATTSGRRATCNRFWPESRNSRSGSSAAWPRSPSI